MHLKIKTAYEYRVHRRSCAYQCPEPNCPRDPMTRERDIQQVVNIDNPNIAFYKQQFEIRGFVDIF